MKTPEGRKKVIELIKGWEHMVGGQVHDLALADERRAEGAGARQAVVVPKAHRRVLGRLALKQV